MMTRKSVTLPSVVLVLALAALALWLVVQL
jgi:hypothetical protein